MSPSSGSDVRERLAGACLDLVRIPSVTGDEAAVARHLERWARAQRQLAGDDVIRRGDALIVGQPDGERPVVALVGHLDTVPPHPDDGAPMLRDGRVIGRGASDMKGSIAVMQVLFETLPLEQLPFALMLVLYPREEGAYADNGLQPLLETYDMLRSLDLALVMEPTDNTLQLGCLGTLHAEVTYRGRAAHSARPWEGENAIHAAAPLLARLADNRPWREVDIGGLVFTEAMSVTMAHGGRARNVIPDVFELNVNYRFAPVGDPQTAMRKAVAEVTKVVAPAEVIVRDMAPPGPVPQGNPILAHLRKRANLAVGPKLAWTDVARLASYGVDAVNFGPGSGTQAHQAGEWIGVDAMVKSYEALVTALTSSLGSY
ncbi:MAG: succinyl-diaminopimelate desuccinylase [Myxococcota bacterium]